MAAQAALEGDQQCVKDMVKVFRQPHDYTVKALNEIDGIECLAGDGTFYAFPDFSKAQAKLNCKTDTDLAEKLLEAGVALSTRQRVWNPRPHAHFIRQQR